MNAAARLERATASAPFRVVRHWDDGTVSKRAALSSQTALREATKLALKQGLPTADGARCTRMEIQQRRDEWHVIAAWEGGKRVPEKEVLP